MCVSQSLVSSSTQEIQITQYGENILFVSKNALKNTFFEKSHHLWIGSFLICFVGRLLFFVARKYCSKTWWMWISWDYIFQFFLTYLTKLINILYVWHNWHSSSNIFCGNFFCGSHNSIFQCTMQYVRGSNNISRKTKIAFRLTHIFLQE